MLQWAIKILIPSEGKKKTLNKFLTLRKIEKEDGGSLTAGLSDR